MKHITHGKSNKAKPNKSKSQQDQQQAAGQQEAQNSFMMPPQVPGIDSMSTQLDPSQVPNGPGFAPH
jgi:hypothetical protein